MLGLSRAQVMHALMSLGTGAAVFLAEATHITSNPWLDAAAYAGLATLAGLGVGVAARSVPAASVMAVEAPAVQAVPADYENKPYPPGP